VIGATGKAENGYQICYVPKARSNQIDRFKKTFPNLTNPTSSMPLRAGNYVMWAEKGKMVSDQVPVTITRSTKKTFDIPGK